MSLARHGRTCSLECCVVAVECCVVAVSCARLLPLPLAHPSLPRKHAPPLRPLVVFTGQRPFGVSFLFAGWDKHFGFQLYQSDPSGNYGGWKAQAIGNNDRTAQATLKTEFK